MGNHQEKKYSSAYVGGLLRMLQPASVGRFLLREFTKDNLSFKRAKLAKVPALFAIERVDHIKINKQKKEINISSSHISITGWAVDPSAKCCARAVYIFLNDKRFEATYGLLRSDVANFFGIPAYINSGFWAEIPVRLLRGRGRQAIKIMIVGVDGQTYYCGTSESWLVVKGVGRSKTELFLRRCRGLWRKLLNRLVAEIVLWGWWVALYRRMIIICDLWRGILKEDGVVVSYLADDYQRWIYRNRLSGKMRDVIRKEIAETAARPQFSVFISPGFYLDIRSFVRTLRSLQAQLYPEWKVYLLSSGKWAWWRLGIYYFFTRFDNRFVSVATFSVRNDMESIVKFISEQMSGDLFLFMNSGDELEEDTLAQAVHCFVKQPDVGVVYTDDDVVDRIGRRRDPVFKSKSRLVPSLWGGFFSPAVFFRKSITKNLPASYRAEATRPYVSELLAWAAECGIEARHIPIIGYHQSIKNITKISYDKELQTTGLRQCQKGRDKDNDSGILEASGIVKRARSVLAKPKNTRPGQYKMRCKTISVLSVSHNLEREGAPLNKLAIDLRLVREGNARVDVISQRGGPLIDSYETAGIQVNILANTPNTDWHARSLVDTVQSILSARSYDLVYANTLESFYAIEAAHAMNVPSIWFIRESQDPIRFIKDSHFTSDAVSMMYGALRKANRLVFPAQRTSEIFQPYDSYGTSVVSYNGIDLRLADEARRCDKALLRKQFNLPQDKKIVVIMGTVYSGKGQLDFAKAAEKILKKRKDIMFVIVGNAEKDKNYVRLVRDLVARIGSGVLMAGETATPLQYFAAADAAVCASYSEAFPTVILEAMSVGLPIVATPVFGIKEQIVNEYSGLFFEVGNIGQLASLVEEVIDNPTFASILGANARRVVETKFVQDELNKQFVKLCHAVASEDCNEVESLTI